MKKIIIILCILTSVLSINDIFKEKEIGNKSIRFRVIARSNSKKDQEDKIRVKNILKKELSKDLLKSKSYNETKNILKVNNEKYNSLVKKELNNNNYKISLGKNYFPSKELNNNYYNKGYYESLVVKIGKGKGKNFWCALYPPLCFAKKKEEKDIEYHFALKDLIKRILN